VAYYFSHPAGNLM